jgi:hypothetical protein
MLCAFLISLFYYFIPSERQLYPTLSCVVPCDFEIVTTFLSSTTVSSPLPCLFTNPALDPTACQLYPVLSPVVPCDFDIVTIFSPSVVFVTSFPDACLLASGPELRMWLTG